MWNSEETLGFAYLMGNSSGFQQVFPSVPFLKAVGDLKQLWLLYRTDGPSQLLKSTSSYQQKTMANGLGACLRCGGQGALVEWVVQHLFNPLHVLPVARDELSHWLFHLLQRFGVLENLDRRGPTTAR